MAKSMKNEQVSEGNIGRGHLLDWAFIGGITVHAWSVEHKDRHSTLQPVTLEATRKLLRPEITY